MSDASTRIRCQLPLVSILLSFSAIVLTVVAVNPAPAFAQSTVVIGGSGKSSVEVNLDILDGNRNASNYGRQLLMPGMSYDQPVTLRMPGTRKTSSARSRTVPKLTLKRPAAISMRVAKRQPALPAPRINKAPVPKVARVVTPPKKAVPVVRPAAPKAPMPIARPAAKPAPKPVQVARQTPAVAPPPPPPAPKMAAPQPAAPKKIAPRIVKAAPVPVVPAAPKPAHRAAPKEQKIASLPAKINVSTPGLAMRVAFSGNSTRISADEKVRLSALAKKMAGSGDRMQLKSYAGGSGETPSASRRRSLSRALAVRSYMIEKGVRSTRIDVRALGMAADQGPSDRVDVIILVR